MKWNMYEEARLSKSIIMNMSKLTLTLRPGRANSLACFGRRTCFIFTNTPKEPLKYCLAVRDRHKCITECDKLPKNRKFNCSRYRKQGRFYFRICKICSGCRCRNRRERCKKLRTTRLFRKQTCLDKWGTWGSASPDPLTVNKPFLLNINSKESSI